MAISWPRFMLLSVRKLLHRHYAHFSEPHTIRTKAVLAPMSTYTETTVCGHPDILQEKMHSPVYYVCRIRWDATAIELKGLCEVLPTQGISSHFQVITRLFGLQMETWQDVF